MKKWFIVLGLLIVGIPSYVVYDFLNVELHELPEGELLSEHTSPNGNDVARVYKIDEGGATVRAAIRVEIDFGDKRRTIYWNYDESTARINWLDDETIVINEQTLNIFTEQYHWKKDPHWHENRE